MGQMIFFLVLQVKQQSKGILICQSKYIVDMLKKFSLYDCKTPKTPMYSSLEISVHSSGDDINPTLYRGMIGSLAFALILFLQPTSVLTIRIIKRSHIFSLWSVFSYTSNIHSILGFGILVTLNSIRLVILILILLVAH